MRKPRGYWTYERCKEDISKMTYLKELQGTSLLRALNKNNWYGELTVNLIKKRKTWTKEYIIELAKGYNHKVDFTKDYNGPYLYASRRGWWDEICSHMVPKCGVKLGESIWTKDKIIELAKNYETKTEFNQGKKKDSNFTDYKAKYAASIARDNGWWEEVCSHMKLNVNNRPRYIYALLWEKEKIAYIGLTQNLKDRFSEHKSPSNSVVYKTILDYGEPKFKNLTKRPVKVKNAGKYEEKWKIIYEELGYKTINVSKTGSLGSYSRIWDYDSVKNEALKYTKRSYFQKKSGGAYQSALKNGWLKDITSHMEIIVGRWDIFENVQAEAVKYRTRKQLMRGCRSASEGAYRNGWMDILYPKENLMMGDIGYWEIKENVKKVALMFNAKTEFSKKYRGAYLSIIRNEWYDLLSHMEILVNRWTNIEDVKEEAKKYKSRGEFQKAQPGAYLVIKKNGWSEEVLSIFPAYNSKWLNFEDVKNEALKYNSRKEFYKFSGSAYNSARKNGWLDEMSTHFKEDTRKKWNDDDALKIGYQCKNFYSLSKNYAGAAKYINRNPHLKIKLNEYWKVNNKK